VSNEFDDTDPTIMDGTTLIEEFASPSTGKHPVTDLPGFEPGFVSGVAFSVIGFRLAMIEDGTDAGIAFLLAQKFERWLKENAAKIKAAEL